MKSNNFTGLYVANCVFQLLILSLIIYNINLWENRFLLYKSWTWFCSKQFGKPNLLEKNGKRSMVINGYFHLSRKVMIWSICGQRCGCTLNSTRNMYEYLNSGMKMAKHFIFSEGLQDSFQAEPTILSKLFLVFFHRDRSYSCYAIWNLIWLFWWFREVLSMNDTSYQLNERQTLTVRFYW